MTALVALYLFAAAPAPDFVAPLSEKERNALIKGVAAMQKNLRGPFAGISWFCNDGTEQLPKLNGCVEHGGGKMYGVLGPDARRAEANGVFVGTVLAALENQRLLENDFYRARALVIERYLERALDGWVLKAAKTYRGFRQDEDEEKAARTLLIALTGDKKFFAQHRALIVRLSKALPYGRGNEGLAIEYRALAAEIGDAERSFGNLRFKIHALPEPADADAVDAWAAKHKGENVEKAKVLAQKLRTYFDPATRLTRLKDVKQWTRDEATKRAIDTFVATDAKDTGKLLDNGIALMDTAAAALRPNSSVPERNLLLLHIMGLVEDVWLGLTADESRRPMSRAQALTDLGKFIRAAAHVGLLSAREHESAVALIARAASGDAAAYVDSVAKLGRTVEWARAKLTGDLGVPMARYQAVEPSAIKVIDDILRAGVMLPLGAVLDRIGSDVESVRGIGHKTWGLNVPSASVRGENHGIALGELRVIEAGGDVSTLKRHEVALLHDLPAELSPVAGIITVGSVGSVSHVALLARNLGIPLASVGSEVARSLGALNGSQILLAVSQARRVALGPASQLSADDQARIAADAKKGSAGNSFTVDSAALDLVTARILKLAEVSEKDAGVRLGPKAAELGRLKRLFPERVSDAAVIPFGLFVRHVDRAGPNGAPSPLAELRRAYVRHHEQLAAGVAAETAAAELLGAMARFRQAVTSLPFAPGFEADVLEALKGLGDPAKIGVFVRSDTNVEDQKDFTGAGLNLTVPNRVGIRNVLAAIREVWASPFTERSFRWRQRLLTNPEHVYPSVLLHRTVPADMSGVMLTTDIETGDPNAITVSVGEGVAAVVDGGAPETLVLHQDGTWRLLASSRSSTRKTVPKPPAQGVLSEFSYGIDPLLDASAISELRSLAAEVLAKVEGKRAGVPWDVEFAFVRGKAFLNQIRPLKINTIAATHPYLVGLDAGVKPPTGRLDLAAMLR